MREILFRGKRVDNGEWVEGYYILFQIGNKPVPVIGPYAPLIETLQGHWLYQVDPATIGQYTGLTDKNGVKIFEGDIVAWRDENFILNGHYTYGFDGYKYGDELIVRCLKSGFMLCKKHDGMIDIPNANSKIDNYAFWNYHGFFEVIGNIFDNELE